MELSIIIPFNNGKKYLDNCLNNLSKVQLNDIDYEIILVDDFSEDESEKIAKRYKKNKYYYTNDRTVGAGNARNLGIKKANGKYIMFLDVDDKIDEDLIQRLKKYMDQDIDMIKFNMRIIGEKIIYEKGPGFKITNGEDAFNRLCFKDSYLDSPCLYLIKKQLLKINNLRFEKNVYHEDFGLIPLLIVNAKTFISTGIFGYNYFQTNNSLMRNKDYEKQIKKINDKLFLYEKLKKKINRIYLKKKTISNLLEYYTNSIIFSIKDLKNEDINYFKKKIKKTKLLNNIQVRNPKTLLKKLILNHNLNIYLKIILWHV